MKRLVPWLLGSSLLFAAVPGPAAAGTLERTRSPAAAVVLDPAQLAGADPVQVSAGFVDRIIRGQPVTPFLDWFRQLQPAALDQALGSQARQLAFWINAYNGYTQHFLRSDPSGYLRDRSAYFAAGQILIAGERLSLEDIEHGILRRGATVLSLGHVRLLATRSAFVQKFAVDRVDYRIHFALNCGARSCPPVMPYTAEALEAQLDAISRDYLGREVRHDAARNRVEVPALLRWFSADFDGGSADAKRAILRRYGLIPPGAEPRLVYRDYDWSLLIENYAEYRP